jgi:drug/metabolite transporter (DMT)-like permease
VNGARPGRDSEPAAHPPPPRPPPPVAGAPDAPPRHATEAEAAAGATRRRRLRGAALVLAAAALWGSFGLFARALFAYGFSPLELTSLRVAIAFAATAVLALLLPGRRARLRITARDVAFFAAYGVLGFASFAFLFFVTVERTTVAVAAALLYTAPAFVVLFARVLWKERFDATKLVALACVLTGVAFVTGLVGGVLAGTTAVPAAAVLSGLASGATYGLYTIFSKVATRRFDGVTTILYAFLFAALALAVLAPPWTAFARAPEAWPLLLGLGLGPSLLAYFLFLRGLRELAAGTASMLASLEPVIAALLAALFLGEALDAQRGVGVLLVVVAAVLLIRRTERSGGTRVAEPVRRSG